MWGCPVLSVRVCRRFLWLYKCSVPSLTQSTFPSSSCTPITFPLILSPPARGCPCLTLINSKCKNHLSATPFLPSSPRWGLEPGPSFLPRLSEPRLLWFYDLDPNLLGPREQAGLIRGRPQGGSEDLQRMDDASGGSPDLPLTPQKAAQAVHCTLLKTPAFRTVM